VQRFHDCRADGDVGNKMAVHDVDMNIIGPGFFYGLYLFPQPAIIGREYGGSNLYGRSGFRGFMRISF